MGIYNSYAEAVIANGHVQGVYCPAGCSGGFITTKEYEKRMLSGVKEAWTERNPADYLESMVDFYTRGLKLVEGDKYANQFGEVITVSKTSVRLANCPSEGDDKRFILKAAVYGNIETPEEREVFEAMSSEAEWVDGLPPVGAECVFTPDNAMWGFNYVKPYTGTVLHYEGEQFVFMLNHEKYDLGGDKIVVSRTDRGEFRKPETLEEYEAGRKLWGLWLACQPEEATLSFDKIDSDIRNAWIELAKRVKVLDNA